MTSSAAIGVFDSGIGGLSVVKEIQKLLPQEHIVYVADSAHAPYGEKAPDFVADRVTTIANWLRDQHQVKAIVVACNTATAIAVDSLREALSIPVIAMEPALKPAVALSRAGIIGVLATQGTLDSNRYARLQKQHGHQVKIHQQTCHQWVQQVEKGDLDSAKTAELVAQALQPVLDAGADVLVLGCTHFPFLAPLIKQQIPSHIQLLDPAPAVAKQLKQRLQTANLLNTEVGDKDLKIYTSGQISQLYPVLETLKTQASRRPDDQGGFFNLEAKSIERLP